MYRFVSSWLMLLQTKTVVCLMQKEKTNQSVCDECTVDLNSSSSAFTTLEGSNVNSLSVFLKVHLTLSVILTLLLVCLFLFWFISWVPSLLCWFFHTVCVICVHLRHTFPSHSMLLRFEGVNINK